MSACIAEGLKASEFGQDWGICVKPWSWGLRGLQIVLSLEQKLSEHSSDLKMLGDSWVWPKE